MLKDDFKTRLYVINIEDIDYAEDYENLYDKCSEARRQRADRIKMERDKIRCVCAHLLLKAAYEDVAKDYQDEIDEDMPAIVTADKGKPYFEKGPLYFNVSHSLDRIVCAISLSEVGCDVECKGDRVWKIAKRFFANEEYEYVVANNDFQAIWTLKESVLKAAGVGLSYSMKDFCVVSDGNIAKSLQLDYDNNNYYLKKYEGDGVYDYSACNRDGMFENSMRRVILNRDRMLFTIDR